MGKRYIILICPIGQINMALHALIKFMKAKTVLVVSYVLIVRELKQIIGVFIIMKNGKNKKHLLEIYFQMKQQEKFMGKIGRASCREREKVCRDTVLSKHIN